MSSIVRKLFLLFVLPFVIAGFESIPNQEPYQFPVLKFFPPMPFDSKNPISVKGVELGRRLFYDPILSNDSTLACASCHRQEFAFSDGNRRFSKGAGEQKLTRNTPPLFNLAWYPRLFWDGRAEDLVHQVYFSVRAKNEMNLPWPEAEKRLNNSTTYKKLFRELFGQKMIDSVMVARAIAQFETTLISYNSKYDRVIRGEDYLDDQEYEGFNLMNDQTRGDCLHCHTTDGDALGTILGFSNNGLDAVYSLPGYIDQGLGGFTGNQEDMGKFKIPSLRNVAITGPYMHDGRFKTLEEVLDFYSEGLHTSINVDSKLEFAYQGGAKLSSREKQAIIVMLHTLTDTVLTTDSRFSKPAGN